LVLRRRWFSGEDHRVNRNHTRESAGPSLPELGSAFLGGAPNREDHDEPLDGIGLVIDVILRSWEQHPPNGDPLPLNVWGSGLRGFLDLPKSRIKLACEEVGGQWSMCAPPTVEPIRLPLRRSSEASFHLRARSSCTKPVAST
jgi:hypothetical protein